MKKTALITAAVIPLTLCSCSFENFGYDSLPSERESENSSSVQETSEVSYETIDIDALNDDVDKLLEDLKISGNEKNVRADVEFLLDKADIAADAMSYSCIDYYLEWDNTELQNIYDQCSEDYYVLVGALGYAFSKGSKYEEYSDIFSDLVTEDDVEYYTQKGMSLARAEGYASVDYRVSDSNTDKYYEISYDDELSDDEKNIKCAEIYLDILANIDPESFYESYNRDYTPDEIIELSEVVKDEMFPVVGALYRKYSDDKYADDLWETTDNSGDPFETIREYSAKISPEIKKSADKIIDEKLYTLATGDNCYTGSFTTDLPTNNSALVYIYSDNTPKDLLTSIHEFGHFHSSFYDEINAYSTNANLDLAEVQSQGMEIIFLQYYDDIFGKRAEAAKNFELYDLADAVVSSFSVGEFEYKALMQADEMTPEGVLELYDEIMGDYAEYYPFYYMSHIYESPGYYISYGVSALAALDIFSVSCDDAQAAIDMYEKLAKIPANSKDIRFRESLNACGFDDVLTEEHIKSLAARLYELTEE